MVNKRAFSLYDVEQFLKEAGAEKIHEKAILSLEKELRDTVAELVNEATLYANYAGRKRVIKLSDVDLAHGSRRPKRYMSKKLTARKRIHNHAVQNNELTMAPKIMLINNVPVVKPVQEI